MYRSEGESHDCAGQADNVVRHREVRCWQADQERFGVQAHEARAILHLQFVEQGPCVEGVHGDVPGIKHHS